MLVETKAITEMGLAFGNTWQVIGIVISGILTMAFLANVLVQKYNIKKPFMAFLLLMGSLLAGYFVIKQGGLGSSVIGKIGTIGLLTVPMFFSGIVFSSLLHHTKEITGVMAINLIGSMLVGILEYNSMYFGFSSLYILGIILYAAAMVSFYLKRT